MHRLDRASVPSPVCLRGYRYGQHTWNDVSISDKQQIREQLKQLQGCRCAYCEGPIDPLDPQDSHIEHFRRKTGPFQYLTFEWDNLYWSCNEKTSCGHYKDNGAGSYNPDDLINPCVDDPDRFFRFFSDGTIRVRCGLSNHEIHRARETLRVFNLDESSGRLRWMRRRAVAGYVSIVENCSAFSPDELSELLEAELAEAALGPFCTAIRHVLTEINA
jgi:uncharacterized protein (TIGR02646 family)